MSAEIFSNMLSAKYTLSVKTLDHFFFCCKPATLSNFVVHVKFFHQQTRLPVFHVFKNASLCLLEMLALASLVLNIVSVILLDISKLEFIPLGICQ